MGMYLIVLSNLFFIDDVVLFVEATKDQATVIREVLLDKESA